MRLFSFVTCIVLALALSTGCTPAPKGAAPAAKVKGVANIDGKSIPTGEIHFSVAGYPPSPIDIKDGKFEGEAPIGKNQVEIFIYVEGPKSSKYGGKSNNKVNTTLEKYWGPDTILNANVEANGANDFKFDITSK